MNMAKKCTVILKINFAHVFLAFQMYQLIKRGLSFTERFLKSANKDFYPVFYVRLIPSKFTPQIFKKLINRNQKYAHKIRVPSFSNKDPKILPCVCASIFMAVLALHNGKWSFSWAFKTWELLDDD